MTGANPMIVFSTFHHAFSIVTPHMPSGGWSTILTDWSVALAIIIVGFWLSKKASIALHKALLRSNVESTLSSFLRHICYALLLILVLISALQKIGVPLASLAAVIGAASLAIGLSLKDSLSNIAAGVMLIILRPMREGDWVVIAGQEGLVEGIRIFQTRINTFDGRAVTLPNSLVTSSPIVNYTTLPTRRLELIIRISFDSDIQKAKELIQKVVSEDSTILSNPEPLIVVNELSVNGINLLLLAHTENDYFTTTKGFVFQNICKELIRNGIGIACEQQQVIRVIQNESQKHALGDNPAARDS